MKKTLIIIYVAAISLISCSRFDDIALWNKSMDMDTRLSTLEELSMQMNTNISSLQTLVTALQENDYITSVSPVYKGSEVIGYSITFTKSPSITIYHGQDGKDGENGADGKDGYTPQIGIRQDSDGHYYWTLDGNWLLDNSGKKIKAEGKDGADGKDGQNGTDGKDGKDGADGSDGRDGKDGITPQFKIENGDWYVSTDNGQTWENIGRATGENGTDGKDGSNGDSLFKSVDSSNPDYVIITLSDGSQIKIPTWKAFEELKKICNEMNTNIQSLQTIIEAMEAGDYIVSCTPLMENGKQIGYTITFAKGGSVVIYHGKDGQNGANGTDGSNGVDGKTPQIGVKQDADGIFYWTVDGEWLTDESGAKIPVTGKDGQAGSKGENGITPQLKIEDGYWYVSYDGGQQWQKLGKATGEDGKDGEGIKITEDEYNVYFDLPDGTRITISKSGHSPSDIIHFDDINVKIICLKNWDTNHDGELSYAEAAAVTSIGTVFSEKEIQMFNEFQFFVNIKEIDERAFYSCENLYQITFPGNINKIGNRAFMECRKLEKFVFPQSLIEIGDYAFANICGHVNPNTITITIPKSVTTIGEHAFQSCNVRSIVFEKNSALTELGAYAFYASYITEICIPANVTVLQPGTFLSCSRLEKISFEEGSLLTTIKGLELVSGSTYRTVCLIGHAFKEFDASNCLSLSKIENGVFYYDSPSHTYTYKIGAQVPPSCSSGTFYNYDGYIYVPNKSIELYQTASIWSKFPKNRFKALEDL